MRTERTIFFRLVPFVSPLFACPMQKRSLATSKKALSGNQASVLLSKISREARERREWKSSFIGTFRRIFSSSSVDPPFCARPFQKHYPVASEIFRIGHALSLISIHIFRLSLRYFSSEKNISVEKLISTFLEFQRKTVASEN